MPPADQRPFSRERRPLERRLGPRPSVGVMLWEPLAGSGEEEGFPHDEDPPGVSRGEAGSGGKAHGVGYNNHGEGGTIQGRMGGLRRGAGKDGEGT